MQRTFFFAGVAGLWLLSLSGACYGQETSPDVIMHRPVTFKVQPASVDDYLIELAQAADVNIIADATHLPTQAAPLTGKASDALGNMVPAIAYDQRLSWWRYNSQTFLFWPELSGQELIALAQQIKDRKEAMLPDVIPTAAQQAGVNQAGQANNQGQPPGARSNFLVHQQAYLTRLDEDREMDKLLTDYLQQTYGWDGKAPGPPVQIKVKDLPPPLFAKMLPYIQRQHVGREREGWSSRSAYLSNAFWNNARLWILGENLRPQPGAAEGFLWIGGNLDQHTQTRMSIGRISPQQ